MSEEDDSPSTHPVVLLDPKPQRRKKWTPFEKLFLVGCLGIPLLLIAPNFFRARAQGSGTACKSNLKNIGTAYEMYAGDWDGAYPASMSQLTPNYLKTVPECPPAGKVTYRAYIGPKAPMNENADENFYYIECFGENHTSVGVTGNYPAYNSVQGLIERSPR